MPTYDYRCKACGYTFDLVQTMSAPVKRKCPTCDALKLERLIGTGAGFIIKGRAHPPSGERDTSASATANDVTPETTSASSTALTPDNTSQEKGSTAKVADATPAKAPTETPPAERHISGATSTPTHKAREGRGVGNLVDKARRMASKKSKPAAQPKPTVKSKSTSKSKPAKKTRRRTKRG